jgi:hypothetical protein
VTSGKFGALLAHIDLKRLDQRLAQFLANGPALLGRFAIDGPLDVEQGVDASHNLDRNGRERDSLLARRLPSRVLLEIGHGKERAAGVDPAPRLDDWTRTSARQIKLAIPVKRVGLEQSGIAGQMALRMLAFAVARVIEHRRRRHCPTEWRVISDIDPTSADIGLAFGQDRHRGVITVQALSSKNMRLDKPQHRVQRNAARPHGVRHRRQADRHAFPSIALGLPVQGLMLAELLEQDHGQQIGARPSPWDHMEGGRRLADLLTVLAGELLPYRFDHLPLARDRFQGPGHVFTQLAQSCAAATVTRHRGSDHHALAREVLGEDVSLRALARERCHCRGLGNGAFRGQLIFGGVGFQLLELQRQLIDESCRSLRAGTVELALQLGDPQFLMRDQGQVFRRLGPCHREVCCARVTLRSHLSNLRAFDCQCRLQRINVVRQICNVIVHDRRESRSARVRQLYFVLQVGFFRLIPRLADARFVADFSSRSPRAYSRAARLRSERHRLPVMAR